MSYYWWFGTWNNPNEKWFEHIIGLEPTYAIAQLEKGENGTPHIQFLLNYNQRQKVGKFKGIPCWIKGVSAKDAMGKVTAYCSKSETRIDGPMEHGIRPADRLKRKSESNLEDDFANAKDGLIPEISAGTQVRYFGNLLKIAAYYAEPKGTDQVRGVWICGRPGVGKSYYARTQWPDLYIKSQSKWWDNYHDEAAVLLDDLDHGGKCLSHHIKIWADSYPFRGEIKGGTVSTRYSTFIVTSNYLPIQIFGSEDSTLLAAIERRFKFIIIYFDSKNTRVVHNCINTPDPSDL